MISIQNTTSHIIIKSKQTLTIIWLLVENLQARSNYIFYGKYLFFKLL